MMKKRIAQVISLVVSMVVVCVLAITCTQDKIHIEIPFFKKCILNLFFIAYSELLP